MKPIVADTDDRRWQAVCERDTRADGQFVFAVLTTGICCRPSCRSRRARRENVRLFSALAAPGAGGVPPLHTVPNGDIATPAPTGRTSGPAAW
ncbi:hypothetical protein M8371_25470, partial [Klebsiella pneumoniae]|nr:hypothetical protein [Klebsiella pneumoniae]